jgi:hypothetical protein
LRSNETFPARHVERQRAVLVDDAPGAIDAPQALRRPPEHVDLLAVARRAADMVQAVAERDIEGGNDLEARDLVGHRPVIAVEPLLGATPHRVDAAILQRLEQIVGDDVRRMMRNQRARVLGKDRRDPRLPSGANLCLGLGRGTIVDMRGERPAAAPVAEIVP